MPRKLPLLTADTEAFWTGGESGRLLINRCNACQHWVHPPVPFCTKCRSLDVVPQPVSGKGKVRSFTVNYQKWSPDMETPYVIAIVELLEQQGLQFLTNIVNCPPERVTINMPVSVVFRQQENIWLPLFEPAES